jgi:hypothetical protein
VIRFKEGDLLKDQDGDIILCVSEIYGQWITFYGKRNHQYVGQKGANILDMIKRGRKFERLTPLEKSLI